MNAKRGGASTCTQLNQVTLIGCAPYVMSEFAYLTQYAQRATEFFETPDEEAVSDRYQTPAPAISKAKHLESGAYTLVLTEYIAVQPIRFAVHKVDHHFRIIGDVTLAVDRPPSPSECPETSRLYRTVSSGSIALSNRSRLVKSTSES